MKGKICMVTGANSGIGKVVALELAKTGATVIMVCRDQGRGEAARSEIVASSGNESIELMLADLSVQASIRELARDFRKNDRPLHVLVNNAGALFMKRQVSADGLEMTLALNHLGYFLLTHLLQDAIKTSGQARIVNVASGAHWRSSVRFDDLQREREYRFMEVYGQSKLANILFTYELARRLDGGGVTANCLHPGLVGTNLAKNNGVIVRIGTALMKPFVLSPEKGAETAVYLATSPEVEGLTGKYFVEKTVVQSSPESNDSGVAQRLWQVSEELTRIR
jgi:NAD(P)-dependent dehydrogenase (short-subunit alcohol dehydrogenase family)